MSGPSPEEIQKRFDRLTEIFSGIVTQADAQASTRCPYRDRHDRCTAKFRCRNQAQPGRNQAQPGRNQAQPGRNQEGATTLPDGDDTELICRHDGTFDYRRAWESDPRTAQTARERIRRQRRRPTSDPPPPS